MTTVKIEGLKELLANLKSIEKVTKQRAVLRKTLDDAGKPVLDAAKSNAAKHGDMADSFIASGKLNKSQTKLEKANKSKTEVVRYIGSNHPAAVMTEFGTDPHILGGLFKGAKHPGTAPSAMLRPAWESNKQEVLNNISEILAGHIAKAIKQQNKRKG